jgi:hypothetical protein
MSRLALRTVCLALLSLAVPGAALAQRELRWDDFAVSAHLGAAGDLRVTETQTMVFTGEWNGGERSFKLHPRQRLKFEGLYRDGRGGWQRLTEDPSLSDVDHYAWVAARTIRWRSRRPSDPPFAHTVIRYQLRYMLSRVLLKEADGYRLDHDFAFAERLGVIDRFALRFTYDQAWQPRSDVREVYTAGPLPPGESFVLSLPLRHTGAQVPETLDLTRPPEIAIAIAVLLGLTTLSVMWFFVREQSYGRFAPLATDRVDERWLREHILKYPAEVIGAAWDESIGKAEVIALIARMVGEGKLGSAVEEGGGRQSSMALTLKVDRSTLEGHERTLVERLFFDGRTETNTELVKAHYSDQGFDPVKEIRAELEASVQRLLPPGDVPRAFRITSLVLFIVGVFVLLVSWFFGTVQPIGLILLLGLGALIIAGIGWAAGLIFRGRIHWGRRAALICLTPALVLAVGTAVFLWLYSGSEFPELSSLTLVGVVAAALALINASINALRSRQGRDAIALRKALAAGREFFIAELRKDRPALRDEWYPWVLAFGLGTQVDDWSAQRSVKEPDLDPRWSRDTLTAAPSPELNSAPPEQWSGFGGGRSGGAGGGASWAAAAGGMAAGVSAPSISGGSGSDSYSSSGGSSGDSYSSSGGSSGDSSSGGGGGGGW